jgi:hypothetical protein
LIQRTFVSNKKEFQVKEEREARTQAVLPRGTFPRPWSSSASTPSPDLRRPRSCGTAHSTRTGCATRGTPMSPHHCPLTLPLWGSQTLDAPTGIGFTPSARCGDPPPSSRHLSLPFSITNTPACQPRFGLWTHPAASPGCSQILGRVHLLGLASHFKAVPRRQEKVLLVPAGLASPSSHALWVDNAPLAALHPAAAGTRNLNPRAQRRGGSRGTHPRHAGLRRVEVPEAAGTMNHHDGACGGGG